MKPKEKAQELVDKHKTLFKHYDANPRLNIGLHEYFKKCALITVDELIRNSFPGVIKNHWEQVKQEIELL